MREYILRFQGKASKPTGLNRVVFRAARVMRKHNIPYAPGEYRVKIRGETDWGPQRGIPGTRARLKVLLKNIDIGLEAHVLCPDDTILRIRVVDSMPAMVDAPPGAEGFWHPELVTAYRMIAAKFKGRVQFAGAYNCRMSRSGGFWSMHSNWPPVLAEDWWCDHKTQDEIEAFLKQTMPDAGFVYVTYRDNSDHDDHIHIQVGSNRSGVPECAR